MAKSNSKPMKSTAPSFAKTEAKPEAKAEAKPVEAKPVEAKAEAKADEVAAAKKAASKLVRCVRDSDGKTADVPLSELPNWKGWTPQE